MRIPKKEEEGVLSTSTEKLLEDERYPLKKISEDVNKSDGYMEEDWYEPRGTNSLRYHYSEEDVYYILKRGSKK